MGSPLAAPGMPGLQVHTFTASRHVIEVILIQRESRRTRGAAPMGARYQSEIPLDRIAARPTPEVPADALQAYRRRAAQTSCSDKLFVASRRFPVTQQKGCIMGAVDRRGRKDRSDQPVGKF